MPHNKSANPGRDLLAGFVVFLIALPLCLGVAFASGAPIASGLLSGIIGGIVVGFLSKSTTSVSGPAAGLTAIVATQISELTFEVFLLALIVAGLFQILLGFGRAGFLSAFFPTSVVRGLIAAIGVILVLKQIPHLLGHDKDPEGEMSFRQPDLENTFSEFLSLGSDFHVGAAVVGLVSLGLLILWDRWPRLKSSVIPAPIIVVTVAVILAQLLSRWGGVWQIAGEHLVQTPISDKGFAALLTFPNFSHWLNPAVYAAGGVLAVVATLETLLNVEAVDKLDPRQRATPSSRELIAQGAGNVLCGLVGGIPITSVIVRSSVNIHAGATSKVSTIMHGLLLLICTIALPQVLNMIPLSCLAAILLYTGWKLAAPELCDRIWKEGSYVYLPFIATVIAIVFTDLLVGVTIGLGISVAFILHSNLRRPLRRIVEKHLGGTVLRIEFGSQVSFLNRAVLEEALDAVPAGGNVLLDARHTVFFDPDVLSFIRDYKEHRAPARKVTVSLLGFREKYLLGDEILYIDYSSRQVQEHLRPADVVQILREGNERFRNGNQLTRDQGRMVDATAEGQFPLAVVLSCIDSRTSSELIFDLGLGDIFSVRIAGNIVSPKVLGSMEYGCAVAGAKLVLVLGHTRCGAVTAAVDLAASGKLASQVTGCQNLDEVVQEIQRCVDPEVRGKVSKLSEQEHRAYVDDVARNNVLAAIQAIREQSSTLAQLEAKGKIAIMGGMYDVRTGAIDFIRAEIPQASTALGNRGSRE